MIQKSFGNSEDTLETIENLEFDSEKARLLFAQANELFDQNDFEGARNVLLEAQVSEIKDLGKHNSILL